MIYIEAAVLTSLLVFGGIGSWTDFQTSKVPNQLLLLAFVVGLILHICLIILGGFFYYYSWMTNMLIADLIAFLMYLARIWAAGDAKLFMVLFYLTPPMLLEADNLSYSVTPFIFIFLPAFVWIIIDSLIRYLRHEPRLKMPAFPIKERFLGMLFIMIESTALYCLISRILPDFSNANEMLLTVIMIVYAYVCSNIRIMRKWYVILLHALIIGVFFALGFWRLTIPDWRSYVLLIVSIMLQRFTMAYNYQLIPTNSVKPGIILASQTVIAFTLSRVHGLPTDASEELSSAISESQVTAIRRWEKTTNGASQIWIVRKVSFAIMIYLGFILWIVIRILR